MIDAAVFYAIGTDYHTAALALSDDEQFFALSSEGKTAFLNGV